MHIQVNFRVHRLRHLKSKESSFSDRVEKKNQRIDLHDRVDLCASSKIFFNCWHLANSEKPNMVCAVQNFRYGNFDSKAICAARAVLPLFGGPVITRNDYCSISFI